MSIETQATVLDPAHAALRSNLFLRLAWVAVIGQAAFHGAWIVAGLIEPHYSNRRQTISELAALDAHHPVVMTIGFLAFGVSLAALAVVLHSSIRGARRSRVGPILLLVAAACMPVVAAARTDCSRSRAACRALIDNGTVSTHHQIHDTVSLLLFVLLVVAPLVFARRFRQDPRWVAWRPGFLGAGAATFVLLVAFVAADGTAIGGLVQRAFLAVPTIWVVAAALHARRMEASYGSTYSQPSCH